MALGNERVILFPSTLKGTHCDFVFINEMGLWFTKERCRVVNDVYTPGHVMQGGLGAYSPKCTILVRRTDSPRQTLVARSERKCGTWDLQASNRVRCQPNLSRSQSLDQQKHSLCGRGRAASNVARDHWLPSLRERSYRAIPLSR